MARRGLWSVLCASLAGCGGCSGSGGASDGGPEPPAEEPRDADGGDAAGPDAGADGGRADGGPDPGPYPEAGWVPLADLPDGCLVERAEHPERVFMPEWQPCPGALASCEMLALPEDGRERVLLPDRGSHDGERGYFVFSDRPVEGSGRWVSVLAATTGSPAGAWRRPAARVSGLCSVARFGLSPTAAAFALSISGDPPPRQERIYHAPLSEIGTRSEPEAVIDASVLAGRFFSQHVQTSATTVGIEMQPVGRVVIVEEGAVRVVQPTAELFGAPQSVTVVGRHVLWEDWPGSTGVRVAQATMDEGPIVYLAPDNADVKHFSTDGERMAWLQGYNPQPEGGYDRLELWAATHTAQPDALSPRMVTELPFRVGDTVAEGFYSDVLFEDGRQRLILYDLTDGRRKTLTLPEPWNPATNALYIHEGELLFGVRHRTMGQTVMRMDVDAIPYD